jgi:hypothetical protein
MIWTAPPACAMRTHALGNAKLQGNRASPDCGRRHNIRQAAAHSESRRWTYPDKRSQQRQCERDIAPIRLSKKITHGPRKYPPAAINRLIFHIFLATARMVLTQ